MSTFIGNFKNLIIHLLEGSDELAIPAASFRNWMVKYQVNLEDMNQFIVKLQHETSIVIVNELLTSSSPDEQVIIRVTGIVPESFQSNI